MASSDQHGVARYARRPGWPSRWRSPSLGIGAAQRRRRPGRRSPRRPTIDGSPIRVGTTPDRDRRRRWRRRHGARPHRGVVRVAGQLPARGRATRERCALPDAYTIHTGDVAVATAYLNLSATAARRRHPGTTAAPSGRTDVSAGVRAAPPGRCPRRADARADPGAHARADARADPDTPTPTPDADVRHRGRRRRCRRAARSCSETARQRRVIRPFPVVRMRGRLTAGGANVSRALGPRAAQAAKVSVRCKGRSCPASRWSRA